MWPAFGGVAGMSQTADGWGEPYPPSAVRAPTRCLVAIRPPHSNLLCFGEQEPVKTVKQGKALPC